MVVTIGHLGVFKFKLIVHIE